jgi:putative oxidoreductase
MQNFASLFGRLFLSLYFLYSGYRYIADIDGTAGRLAAHNISYAETVTFLLIALQILGGILLFLGFKTRWAAGLLAAFLIVVTFIFHARPANPDEAIQLMENAAILGGLLYVFSYGPGAWGMDGGKRGSRGAKPKLKKEQ